MHLGLPYQVRGVGAERDGDQPNVGTGSGLAGRPILQAFGSDFQELAAVLEVGRLCG